MKPHWAFDDRLNLTELMMEQSYPFESKKRFIQWLIEKYETISNLNESWGSSYSSFEHIVDEYQYERVVSENCEKDFTSFNRILIRRYVELPAKYCKEVDPNHLNLGMRYAWISNDDLLEGCEVSDVFSINSYQVKPDAEQIEHTVKN
jgi:beta-galactosidase GanA